MVVEQTLWSGVFDGRIEVFDAQVSADTSKMQQSIYVNMQCAWDIHNFFQNTLQELSGEGNSGDATQVTLEGGTSGLGRDTSFLVMGEDS